MPVYSCPTCSYITEDKSRYNAHEITHMPKDFPCPNSKCPRSFRTRSRLQNHILNSHGDYPCEMCNATFGSSKILSNHKR